MLLPRLFASSHPSRKDYLMLNKILNRPLSDQLWIFCDGSSGAILRTEGGVTAELAPLGVTASAAAVARRSDGTIIDWAWNTLPNLTNNEAEYAGLLLGLELARRHQPREAIFVLDSDVVVGQVQGRFAVNSPGLRPWHGRACAALRSLPSVRIYAVPRSWNRLADGLTGQAGIPWRTLTQAIEHREQNHAKATPG
jgi:ribonuclease HI